MILTQVEQNSAEDALADVVACLLLTGLFRGSMLDLDDITLWQIRDMEGFLPGSPPWRAALRLLI